MLHGQTEYTIALSKGKGEKMARFNVVVKSSVIQYLNVELVARDELAVHEKVEAVIKKYEGDCDKIAKYYESEWQIDEEILEIEEVSEE